MKRTPVTAQAKSTACGQALSRSERPGRFRHREPDKVWELWLAIRRIIPGSRGLGTAGCNGITAHPEKSASIAMPVVAKYDSYCALIRMKSLLAALGFSVP